MQRRLFIYKDRLEDSLKLLLKRDYKIVVIGSIGAGKSTAICELAGLTIPNTRDKSVLETGAGGTTICEVHLLTGSEYQIKIEPCTDDELRDHVKDFSDYLLAVTATKTEDANNDSQGISKEVDRALRNMSGLGVRKEKQDDGKTIVIDDAKELAKQFTSVRELSIKVMELMELHKRDCKNVYFDSCTSKEPFEWLKNTFASINNGRHPDFTLPKRIEIIVPFALLDHNEYSSVRIIDTNGVDRTVARQDLECHVGYSHTLTNVGAD